mgnify:CR=1 FL=1
MKVKISNYPTRLTCDLYSNYMNRKYGYVDWPLKSSKLEKVLCAIDDLIQAVYNVINRAWFDRKEQYIQVKIDPWDTYSMDDTLAHIILPMLKQLKANKQSSPFVDLEDVPKELRGKKLTKKQQENGELDDKHHERWDWVLDEMIYAFETKIVDTMEDQFFTGESDYQSVVATWDSDGKPATYELVEGPDHTMQFDSKGWQAHQQRVQRGFELFGKYYSALWS